MMDRRRRLFGRLFRAVPGPIRDFAVRRTTPSYVLGAMCRVERDDGRVLLVKPSYRSVWTLPGGVSARGESPIDCMRRELHEETGVRCEVIGEPVVLLDPKRRMLDFVYRARLAPGIDPSDARATSLEIAEVGWFEPAEIAAISGAFARKALSVDPDNDTGRVIIVEHETPDRGWWPRR
jgi:ADP-ribose pyrophosphatase YjhB (NUDIX family)